MSGSDFHLGSTITFPALGFAGLPNHHFAHGRSVGRPDIRSLLDVNRPVENTGVVRPFRYIYRNDIASLNIIQGNREQYLRGDVSVQEEAECLSIFFTQSAEHMPNDRAKGM